MDNLDRYSQIKKATHMGIFINTLLAVVKTIVGIIGKSPALVADGVHSFADLASDFMVLFAGKYANKKEDLSHPYGHERIETLATVGLSLLLIIIGIMMAYHSIKNLVIREYLMPNSFTIYAAIFSIVSNEFIYQYTMKIANKINSDLLRANAWHSRSDMWSSVVVLIGLLGSLFGFVWMDSIASLIVCYMVIKMGLKWGYSSISELIDEGVDEETNNNIKNIILSVEGVVNAHCLRTRKMAGKIILDVHVLVDKHITASEGHYIAENVRAKIYYGIDDIKDVTVHIDVDNHEDIFIKEEQLPPSRNYINNIILNFFDANNMDKSVISKKKMFIYYLEDKIEIYLFILDSSFLNIYQQKLNNLTIENYNINIIVFAHN